VAVAARRSDIAAITRGIAELEFESSSKSFCHELRENNSRTQARKERGKDVQMSNCLRIDPDLLTYRVVLVQVD